MLALDSIEATVYAARVLEIPARRMSAELTVYSVDDGGSLTLPLAMFGTVCRMTPGFEAAVTGRFFDRKANAARSLKYVAERRGATVKPAYDVPETMDVAGIEAWLGD